MDAYQAFEEAALAALNTGRHQEEMICTLFDAAYQSAARMDRYHALKRFLDAHAGKFNLFRDYLMLRLIVEPALAECSTSVGTVVQGTLPIFKELLQIYRLYGEELVMGDEDDEQVMIFGQIQGCFRNLPEADREEILEWLDTTGGPKEYWLPTELKRDPDAEERAEVVFEEEI